MLLEDLFKAAYDGAPEAQYVLGLCYSNGWGVESDNDVAEKWFLSSAQRGMAAAQYELSLILQAPGKNRIEEGIYYLRKAAEQGYLLAQHLLSHYCEQGIGVAVDFSESFRLCLLAAQGGYRPAARRVALMLEQGIGIGIDSKQAFEWYLRASELGDVDSTTSIAKMYANGIGTEKNESKALEWLHEGQRRGSPWAFLTLSRIYRFGELGQAIDSQLANHLATQGQKLLEDRAGRGAV